MTSHVDIGKAMTPLYLSSGAILHLIQQFELSLQYSIALLRDLETDNEDGVFDDEFDILSSLTLGKLINLFKKHFCISNENLLKIDLALKERNKIIHGFFILNAESLSKKSGRQKLLNELKKSHLIIYEAFFVMHPIVEDMMIKSNLDPAFINEATFNSIEI